MKSCRVQTVVYYELPEPNRRKYSEIVQTSFREMIILFFIFLDLVMRFLSRHRVNYSLAFYYYVTLCISHVGSCEYSSCGLNDYCEERFSGGYTCVCSEGFQVDKYGKCQDINDCEGGVMWWSMCNENADCINYDGRKILNWKPYFSACFRSLRLQM